MKNRDCKECGRSFEVTHGNQTYCPEHRQRYVKPKPCASCGTRIQPSGNQIYCISCQHKLKIRPKRVCVHCNTEFTVGAPTQRYCTKSCRRSSRSGGITRDCRTCGTSFKPVCNQQYCKGCQPKSHRRKPQVYKQFRKDACERCGFVPENICQLDVHHKDRDPFNNDPANLETLCANCHRLENVGPRKQPGEAVAAPAPPTDAFEERVKELSFRMPQRNAEQVARKESR